MECRRIEDAEDGTNNVGRDCRRHIQSNNWLRTERNEQDSTRGIRLVQLLEFANEGEGPSTSYMKGSIRDMLHVPRKRISLVRHLLAIYLFQMVFTFVSVFSRKQSRWYVRLWVRLKRTVFSMLEVIDCQKEIFQRSFWFAKHLAAELSYLWNPVKSS
jgi:hypothetical protein